MNFRSDERHRLTRIGYAIWQMRLRISLNASGVEGKAPY